MAAMKVVFIYFDFMKGAGGKYYEGIASISAVLKENNHSTQLFHVTDYEDVGQFMEIYERLYADCDIAAFSATSNAFYYVPECAQAIKGRFEDVITICGGTHATLCPADVIRQEAIDIVCVGEGEYPMLELCDFLQAGDDITNIANLWVKKGGDIFRNPPRPVIADIDSLPMSDRDLFDFEHSVDKQMKRISFMGSRGCPFNCTHCCNHALKQLCSDSRFYVRFKSVERLISEIKFCLAKYEGVEFVHFLDDILTLRPSWFRDFTKRYKEEIKFPYVCNSRFDLLNEETIDLLCESGCVHLHVGLESGDDYIRTEVLKRRQSRRQICEVSELCHKKGVKLYLYTMVGIPFETLSRALNTVKLTARLNPSGYQMSIYYPYEKTHLYNLCEAKGFLTGNRLDSYFESDTVLNLPNFRKEHILFAYHNFERFVSYYVAAAKFRGFVRILLEKLIGFMWHNPRLYLLLEPRYYRVKQIYKRLRRKR